MSLRQRIAKLERERRKNLPTEWLAIDYTEGGDDPATIAEKEARAANPPPGVRLNVGRFYDEGDPRYLDALARRNLAPIQKREATPPL